METDDNFLLKGKARVYGFSFLCTFTVYRIYLLKLILIFTIFPHITNSSLSCFLIPSCQIYWLKAVMIRDLSEFTS